MASPIDYKGFPHIVETILSFCDFDEVVAFWFTCRRLMELADKSLLEHVVIVGNEKFGLPVLDPREGPPSSIQVLHPSNDKRVPRCHPESFKHTRTIDIGDDFPCLQSDLDAVLTHCVNAETVRLADLVPFEDVSRLRPKTLVRLFTLAPMKRKEARRMFVPITLPDIGVENLVLTVLIPHEWKSWVPSIVNLHKIGLKSLTMIFICASSDKGAVPWTGQTGVVDIVGLSVAEYKLSPNWPPQVPLTLVGVVECAEQVAHRQASSIGIPPGPPWHIDEIRSILGSYLLSNPMTEAQALSGIEFLSTDEYRARVGEQAYDLHTINGC